MEPNFKTRLIQIDNGRFKKIIDVLDIDNNCEKCFYLNPKISDPGQGYRCMSIPGCPAATLNSDVISYWFFKLGDITYDQHINNVNSNLVSKV